MGKISEIPKIPISFKQNELYLYEFIKSKRNASCYIKDLVEKDMKNNGKTLENNITSNNNLEFDF